MTTEREQQFIALVKEFPDSPMGHFSLGKYYLDAGQYAQSVECLKEATRLDVNYAAAFVALGDAYAGLSDVEHAKAAYAAALKTPHGQRDASLAADVEHRLAELN